MNLYRHYSGLTRKMYFLALHEALLIVTGNNALDSTLTAQSIRIFTWVLCKFVYNDDKSNHAPSQQWPAANYFVMSQNAAVQSAFIIIILSPGLRVNLLTKPD